MAYKCKALDLESGFTMIGFSAVPNVSVSRYRGTVWMGRPVLFKERDAWKYMCLVGSVWRQYYGGHHYCDNAMTAFNSALLGLNSPPFILITKP